MNNGTGGFSENVYDIRRSLFITLYNTVLGSSSEVSLYGYQYAPLNQYTKSYHHDGVAGAYKAWSPGAIVISQTTTKPTGKTFSYQAALADATYWGFFQREFTLDAGQTIKINCWLKKDANGMTALPQVQIISKLYDPLLDATYSPLTYFEVADNTDWQTATLTYTNTDTLPREFILRFQGKNASGNLYAYYEIVKDGVPRSRTI